MNKYNALWEYIRKNGSPSMKLSFDEIHKIAGYQVGKISLKEQTVIFNKVG
ncbi:MAG: hypothetical protein AB7D36_07455 [Oscillospiraceae bacterium]